MLAPFAARVCLAFPLPGRGGVEVARHRAPGARRAPGSADRAAARARLGVPADGPCLLVFGGSLGARRLNDAALEAFGAAAPVHGAARGGPARLRLAAQRGSTSSARRRTTGCSRTSSRSRTRSPPRDLAAARAGGSVFELAAAGLPSILVPYPHATGNHQAANARFMERGRRGDRDPGRRAGRSAAGARGGRPARRRRSGWPRCRTRRERWRGRTRPSGWPRRCCALV